MLGAGTYNEILGVGYDSGDVDVPHAIYGNKTWLSTAPADFQIYPYSGRIEAEWTAPTNANGFVLLRSSSKITDEPLNGTGYSIGNTIGSSTVVYSGSSTNFEDTGLTNDSIYYYKIFSYIGSAGSEVYYGSAESMTIPKQREYKRISSNNRTTCHLNAENKPYCAGETLANGTNTDSQIPLAINSVPFVEIASGDGYACAIDFDGDLYCWGYNNKGGLGSGNTTNSSTSSVTQVKK